MQTTLPDLANYKPQKRNCTVVALAATADIPYDRAYAIAKEAGRKDNRGFRSELLIKHFNKKLGGRQFRKIKRTKITVQKFCKVYSEGRYYVRKKGHAYAIINGMVVDRIAPKPLERIVEAWQFIGNLSNNKTKS